MKIKITRRTQQTIEEEANPLLIEPIPDEPDFFKVHRSLIEELFETTKLLSENEQTTTDPEKWCEERGYFALKGLLIKINAIQQASKGKFGS